MDHSQAPLPTFNAWYLWLIHDARALETGSGKMQASSLTACDCAYATTCNRVSCRARTERRFIKMVTPPDATSAPKRKRLQPNAIHFYVMSPEPNEAFAELV